jgi:hypothetical protein
MGSQGGGGCIVRKEGDNKRAWLHFYLLASPVQSFQVNRVGNYKITTEEKIINWRIRISNLVSTSHYGHWLISTRGRTNSSVTTSRFFYVLDTWVYPPLRGACIESIAQTGEKFALPTWPTGTDPAASVSACQTPKKVKVKNKIKKRSHHRKGENRCSWSRDVIIYVMPSMLSKVHRRRFRTQDRKKNKRRGGITSQRGCICSPVGDSLHNILHAALFLLLCYIQQVRVREGGRGIK